MIQTKTQINSQAKIMLCFNDLKQTNKKPKITFSFYFNVLNSSTEQKKKPTKFRIGLFRHSILI